MNRLTASRTSVQVKVGPPGSSQIVTVKAAATTDDLAGYGTATAELAEAEAAAQALGWPVRAVCEAAIAQYRTQAAAPRLHRQEHDIPNGSQYGDSSHPQRRMRAVRGTSDLGLHCGRYWDRTSDLLGVNEALSR